MRVKVKMPKLGLTMMEAKILEWRKAVQNPVTAGEVLAVIETDKADVEIESPASGIMMEIVGEAGRVYQVGEVIAIIQTDGPAGVEAGA